MSKDELQAVAEGWVDKVHGRYIPATVKADLVQALIAGYEIGQYEAKQAEAKNGTVLRMPVAK